MKYSKLHPDFFQGGGYSPVQFSSSQFIPTYAGAPLAEAQRNAEQTAGIYHQNLADLTKIDIMNANRKVNPSVGDQAENEKINARLSDQFKNITSKGDLENQTLQVNALLREYMNDPAVKTLTESRANADREAAFQQEARSKGATIVLDNPAEEHQSITYDERGKPIYNVYKGTGQIKLNWEGRKAEIADKIKPDGGPLNVADLQGAKDAVLGYITTGSWKGISGGLDKNGVPTGKVGKMLDHLVKAYKQTAEFTQEKAVDVRELMQQGLSQEEANTEAERLARERMFSEGMLRTFSDTDRNYLTDWMLKDQLDKAKLNPPPGPWATGPTSAVTNPLVESKVNLLNEADPNTGQVKLTDAVVLKKDGKTLSEAESKQVYDNAVKASGTSYNPGPWLAENGYTMGRRTKEEVTAQNAEINDLLTRTFKSTSTLLAQNFDPIAAESIRQVYPNLVSFPPGYNSMSKEQQNSIKNQQQKDLFTIQKEATTGRVNVTTPQILQTREEVIDEGKMLNYVNNIAEVSGNELSIAMPKELKGGSYKNLNGWNGVQAALKDIASKNGLNTDKPLTYTGHKQGMSTGNPFGISGATNTVITIKDADGTMISVPMMAAPNKQLQAVMAPLNSAWMKANNGEFGEFSVYWPGFKENFTVENYPTHENGTWETKSRVKLPDQVSKLYHNKKYVDFDEFTNLWYELDRPTIDAYKNTFIQ